MKALIFDCDGVLVDTERDGHRVAFNRAFRDFELDIDWDVALYGRLLKQVAGGKERLHRYFDEIGWPVEAGDDRAGYIARLHGHKSRIFSELVRDGAFELRAGVTRMVDEALANGIRLGVCTTARESSVLAVLDLMGAQRKSRFEHVLAGDIVSRKKPDPEIYLLAAERFGLAPGECMVIEDSHIGMRAALGAGMRCIITTSSYTLDEDFTGAGLVVPELGDPPAVRVTIEDLARLSAAPRMTA
jgi:HAD superfamily hydrolase (TIGR01509 family)